MILWESVKLAFKSIWAHKVRSFLTMLGILIGISSVVLLVSLGEGVKEDIKGMINDLGSNFVFVVGGNIDLSSNMNTSSQGQNEGGMKTAFGNPANLISGDIFKPEDMSNILEIDGVEKVAPMGMVSGILKYNDEITSPLTMASTQDMQYIWSGLKIDRGRFIDQTDEDDKKQAIVLGSTPAKNLFGDEDPIGKKIKIVNQEQEYEFEVIGTFAKPTNTSLLSSDMDTLALIPYQTAKNIFYDGKDDILRIAIKVQDGSDVKKVSEEIQKTMEKRLKPEEFTVLTQDDMLGMLDDILSMMTLFISAIAAISLVVGGVGIMNIMLVSVTERTKEIGLRKAVGATNGAILFQFLMEAIILSVLAGIISLILVQIGTEIVKHYTQIEPVITSQAVFLSVGVCIAIGLVFGIAPAVQASRKDPIESLRYE